MVRLDDSVEPAKITAKDKKLIGALVENSRIPLSQLTKKVQLSRDAVDYRIKRLEEKGVIQRFHPRINYTLLGFNRYHVFFLLDEINKQKQAELIQMLKEHPSVRSIMEYNDKWDLEVTILAKNVGEFDEILMDIVNQYPQLLLEKDKILVIKRYAHLRLPTGFVEYQPKFSELPDENVSLDETDKKLLKKLCVNARASSVVIGKEIGLSSDAVLYRIKQLQKKQIIINFSTEFNLAAMGYSWYTCGIQMKRFDKKSESKLQQFVKTHPSIIRAVKTLGTWEVLLYVAATGAKEFHSTLKDIKKAFSEIIRDYDVWIAYKEHYYNPFPDVLGQ